MKTDRIRNVVAAGLLATLLPLSAAAEPDPNLLTGLTFNDGVRDLTMARGNSSGLHGPGLYYVWVPPGVRRVTVTPTWTNSQITGVTASARDITYGKDTTAPSAWGSSDSGTGKELRLERGTTPKVWGNGATMLTLELSGSTAVNGVRATGFSSSTTTSWKSAEDRLSRLMMRTDGGTRNGQWNGQWNAELSGSGGGQLDAASATPGGTKVPRAGRGRPSGRGRAMRSKPRQARARRSC